MSEHRLEPNNLLQLADMVVGCCGEVLIAERKMIANYRSLIAHREINVQLLAKISRPRPYPFGKATIR
jgi:hypothetical protein